MLILKKLIKSLFKGTIYHYRNNYHLIGFSRLNSKVRGLGVDSKVLCTPLINQYLMGNRCINSYKKETSVCRMAHEKPSTYIYVRTS